jgi:hypothetical protein
MHIIILSQALEYLLKFRTAQYKNKKKKAIDLLICQLIFLRCQNVLQHHPSSQRSTKQKYSQVFCSDI